MMIMIILRGCIFNHILKKDLKSLLVSSDDLLIFLFFNRIFEYLNKSFNDFVSDDPSIIFFRRYSVDDIIEFFFKYIFQYFEF